MPEKSLFQPGGNCWETRQANRVALLVDGQEYFEAFARAAEQARHSILILAWDFDSRALLYQCAEHKPSRLKRLRARMRLHGPPAAGPIALGDFLNRLTRRRRLLQVHVLIWDYPMVFGLDREFPPLYGLGWRPRRRVHVCYDNTQPVGASHHQKIVVIDDQIAFCGGLDLTARRWDTCAHKVSEPRRIAGSAPYPPFHDLMMAVDGECAQALGRLARERWKLATGKTLHPPGRRPAAVLQRRWRRRRVDLWPPSLTADFTDTAVAISRTLPATDAHPAVSEVEQLYLDMIASARRCIYIENQYFTCHSIGEALARRLEEEDGPEIVMILRLLSHGWLEALSMEALRTRLLRQLQAADRHGRFRFYYPHVRGLPAEQCIDVHSKCMVVDDEVLRIGSANLSNRSMGMDTECDLTIEARGEARAAETIAGFRTRLLAEHLGVDAQQIQDAHARLGSLGAAIETLKRNPEQLQEEQHTLGEFEQLREIPDALADIMEFADPEKPVSLKELAPQFGPTYAAEVHRPAWGRLAAIFLALLGLAAAWRWTPLSEYATPERIRYWVAQFADAPWAPFVVLIAYIPACVTMFPRPLITLFAVLAFGPWWGFALAMSGNLLAGWASHVAGQRMSHDTLRRLAGPNFSRISAVLRQRGVLAVTAVRLVPLAPYAIPGLVAGAARVRMWHFLLGTFLGLLPGVLTTTVFGDAMQEALEDPDKVNYWIVGGVVTVFVVGTWWVRRWLLTTQIREEQR